jgi:hypothetical protein
MCADAGSPVRQHPQQWLDGRRSNLRQRIRRPSTQVDIGACDHQQQRLDRLWIADLAKCIGRHAAHARVLIRERAQEHVNRPRIADVA